MTRVILVSLIVVTFMVGSVQADEPWQRLDEGLEIGQFKLALYTVVGDSTVTILRIDPELWEFELVCAAEKGLPNRFSVKDWCLREGLTAAVNAGMYAEDYMSHVGYLRSGDHVNESRINHYQSVLGVDPVNPDDAGYMLYDLDAPGVSMDEINERYGGVVQNLRLIKRPGENRWKQQPKMWSEVAIGQDDQGRALFIFCRAPYTMHDLNDALLALPIDLVAAQHLDGGPAAEMFVQTGSFTREWQGSYETDFSERDDLNKSLPIPNIIGIRKKTGDRHGASP